MDNQTSPQEKQEKGDLTKLSFLSILIILMLAMMYSGCRETCDKQLISYSEPVYTVLDDVRVTASYESPRAIETPGKIYYKDEFIYINEIDKGIHVIDNTDKANPRPIGFINIPGNKDLAARGDFMYADNYMDLVVLNIADKSNITEISRVEDVFDTHYILTNTEAGISIITDWIEVEEEVDVNCDEGIWGWGLQEDTAFKTFDVSAANSSTTGVGGSLARFTIADDYLYTISEYSMTLFDITTLDNPVLGNTIELGWGIETIFPYEDKLFLGARDGMHIYDNSNPQAPVHISTYAHINTCDPVVVQGDIAYVTLRSGNTCESFTNQLDVIDISDLANPTQIASYDMDNPHGLGVSGTCLFIAEGEFGLKVFDITDVNAIGENLIAHHKDVHALDVIPLNDVLFMIGNDGLYQYNYDCGSQLEYISDIAF